MTLIIDRVARALGGFDWDRTEGGSDSPDSSQVAPGLGWAVLFLHVCIAFSILRTLEYLNVPVWDWVARILHATATLRTLA